MKDKFTRKTWYSVLVLSAVLNMSAGFSALVGVNFNSLNLVAFGAMGLATAFLAAERDNERKTQNSYFLSFMCALLGYAFGGFVGVAMSAMAWPILFYTEIRRGAKIMPQLQMLLLAEVTHAVFTTLVVLQGMQHLGLYMNIFGILSAIAQGWGAYILLKTMGNNKGVN